MLNLLGGLLSWYEGFYCYVIPIVILPSGDVFCAEDLVLLVLKMFTLTYHRNHHTSFTHLLGALGYIFWYYHTNVQYLIDDNFVGDNVCLGKFYQKYFITFPRRKFSPILFKSNIWKTFHCFIFFFWNLIIYNYNSISESSLVWSFCHCTLRHLNLFIFSIIFALLSILTSYSFE